MKKLIFLISLCLLSQNYTMPANAGSVVPVPTTTEKKTVNKQKQESKPAAAKTAGVTASASKQTVNVKAVPPVPVINNTPVAKVIEKEIAKELPITPIKLEEKAAESEIKTAESELKETEQEEVKTVVQEVENYLETTDDQQKYKIYDNKKLQAKLNPIPLPTSKFNMRAEKGKNSKPPVIVEDNLSTPEDSDLPRATIKQIEFSPSQVFSKEDLEQLAAPLLSQPVTIEDIQKVVNGITRCYILGDYATSKAYLPPQDLSDGVLKIGLFEGKVGKVNIQNNRWTKRGYIESRLNIQEGDLFKLGDLEKDVIKFNNNNSIKLKVGLEAGENQGETDVTIDAIDPFPFHVAFMTDNQGRKTIGTTRWGGMLEADSLFGHRDKFTLGGYLGRGNRVGFADYNFPINKYGTRLGASVSAGNISVVNGPLRPFGIGGISQVYSAYLTHPLFDREDLNISSYSSANIKRSTTDISGFKLPSLGTFSLTQGFNAKKDTEKGIWYTGHFASVGMQAFGGDEDFFKYEGNITRLHDFGHGIVGQFRLAGQYSPQDRLPWMEQFQIGGLSTVRGYSEGLLLGKSGYLASAEIITPLPFLPKAIGSDKLGYIYPREMIKGAVFMDNGMVFPYKYGNEAIDSGDLLMSWGLGLRINLRQDLAARMYWGFGLTNKYDVDQKMGRFHFDITCAPDIGRVVASRTPKKKKQKKENL